MNSLTYYPNTYSMNQPDKNTSADKPVKMRSRSSVIISELICIYSLDTICCENILVKWIKRIFNRTFNRTDAQIKQLYLSMLFQMYCIDVSYLFTGKKIRQCIFNVITMIINLEKNKMEVLKKIVKGFLFVVLFLVAIYALFDILSWS